jgi:hypothetical protein
MIFRCDIRLYFKAALFGLLTSLTSQSFAINACHLEWSESKTWIIGGDPKFTYQVKERLYHRQSAREQRELIMAESYVSNKFKQTLSKIDCSEIYQQIEAKKGTCNFDWQQESQNLFRFLQVR